ncbi:NB-ARC domain-containing protein [Lentzea sp. NPDC055074]
MSTSAFGDVLQFHRSRVALTQEELADRTGLSQRAISDVERGRTRTPQLKTVALLVTGLGLEGEEAARFAALARAARRHDDPELPASVSSAVTACAVPPVLVTLTGREREQRVLDGFARHAGSSSQREVAVIHGPPGVGKTALVVDTGHRVGARFADGCAFVDLRGAHDEPVPPDRAAHRLLRSFGVDEQRIPAGGDDTLAAYRSAARDRTALVVLDDAADEAQVRPLLAAGPGTLVVVTARHALTGLDAAHRLALGLLSPDRSADLLRVVAGASRLEAEPGAASRVAASCGGLPLAVVIAGNRLASRPQWTVEHLAAQLEDERRRLSVLRAGDLRVRTVFETSYHRLGPGAARLFRRLALVPGRDVCAAVAERLAGTGEEALEELVCAGLLGVGGTPGRYLLHDLPRVFAAERLEIDEDAAGVRAAAGLAGQSLMCTTSGTIGSEHAC